MSSARCEALLAWYREHARDFPWRRTTDPYRIWVSEIMLQQTQTKTVLPRYHDWFARFPSIASLAEASLDDVLKAWEGLGYYRRARLLHRAARRIIAEHGGVFPRDFDAILRLPGVGRSTAGAIASICFAANTPVLDGNVKRVLRRWTGNPEASDKELWRIAQAAIDASGDPACWNQAMMDLGAMLCSPARADCAACPVASFCASRDQASSALENRRPARVRDIYLRVTLHLCPSRGLWLVKRPQKGIWAGLWTPPMNELEQAPNTPAAHVHLLTHRRLHLYAERNDAEPAGMGRWVADTRMVAIPTGIRRLLEKLAIPACFTR